MDDPELVTLSEDRTKLQSNDDRTRDGLRRQRQVDRPESWTEARLAALCAMLGPHWRWEPIPQGQGRFRLSLRSDATRPWALVLAAVAAIESQSGIVIESLTVAAEGKSTARRLNRAELNLWFDPDRLPSANHSRDPASTGPQTSNHQIQRKSS
ncbi:MAG: hypothetical protein PSW75_04270, partial [bacterium]|nr:hypothetical protein [bacterium]